MIHFRENQTNRKSVASTIGRIAKQQKNYQTGGIGAQRIHFTNGKRKASGQNVSETVPWRIKTRSNHIISIEMSVFDEEFSIS